MNAGELKRQAIDEIERCRNELHELSQQIWDRPELKYQETYAHKILTDYLESKGFHVERSFTLDTAFRATSARETTPTPIRQRGATDGSRHQRDASSVVSNKTDNTANVGVEDENDSSAQKDTSVAPEPTTVGICSEYDALPTIGHACGHNLIAIVGVAAGLGVKAALHGAKVNLGQVCVLGTPAEEGGGGKIRMLEAGAFRGLDIAMMAHPAPDSDTFPLVLARQALTVTYQGKAAHASSFPWEGVNALDAAVMAYQSVSNLRQQLRPEWRVHGVISDGGARPNVIPERSQLLYYLRAPTLESLKELRAKVTACFNAAATATGCTVEIDDDGEAYRDLKTNAQLAAAYETNAHALGARLGEGFRQRPISTDMGNVSHVVPAIHPMFALHAPAPLHTAEFTKLAGAPEALQLALDQAKALAMTAIDFMTSSDLQAKVEFEFKQNGGAE